MKYSKSLFIRSLFPLVGIVYLLVLTGCNMDQSFSSVPADISKNYLLNSPSAPGGPTAPGSAHPSAACVQVLQNTTAPLRILFMVDNSGSTNQTDPQHNYRVKTVQQFLATYGAKTNFSYSFGYFFGTTALAYDASLVNFVADPSYAFGGPTDLSMAVTLYSNQAPGGNTPYAAAFAEMKSIIMKDEALGNSQNFSVVFMSDGLPTDIQNPVDAGIIALVDALKQSANNNGKSLLTVSAVYFGPATDAQAIGRLTLMAKQGHGIFVDTNLLGGAALSLDSVVSVPGTVCGE